MKVRDDSVYLKDILEAIDHIERYISGFTQKDFEENIMVYDAVVRRFEIIGEAAGNVSSTLKEMHPDIEWTLMKDMRNKLIHQYFGLSAETIFTTVKKDLPLIKDKISAILKNNF